MEAQLYYNYADYVMDNDSLREFRPGNGMNMPVASNVDRTTWRAGAGARLIAGARRDHSAARNFRQSAGVGHGMVSGPNSTSDEKRERFLTSGFLRY